MLLPKNFVTRDSRQNRQALDTLIEGLCHRNGLVAYIICSWDFSDSSFETISSWPVPLEPLKGNERTHVETMIKDCIGKYPQMHCHAIGHIGMPNILRRLKNELQGITRAWFIPMKVGGDFYLFFGFPAMSMSNKVIPELFIQDLFTLLEAKHSEHKEIELRKKMEVMEKYVKEVGHDIASAVQATIAKLRNISDGLIPAEFIGTKAAEAEAEIMAAYRVSEGLGVTMEQNYQIKEFKSFNLVDVCQSAIVHHLSEANERHLTLSPRTSRNDITLVGDRAAFEQLIGHLLSNAIKYSQGNTRIDINLNADAEFAGLKLSNIGIRLPQGSDRQKIWDFGFRGNEAKNLHVNGSGIGLFTVKKIILAHHGTISVDQDNASRLTVFDARIPLASYLRRRNPELFVDALAKGNGK